MHSAVVGVARDMTARSWRMKEESITRDVFFRSSTTHYIYELPWIYSSRLQLVRRGNRWSRSGSESDRCVVSWRHECVIVVCMRLWQPRRSGAVSVLMPADRQLPIDTHSAVRRQALSGIQTIRIYNARIRAWVRSRSTCVVWMSLYSSAVTHLRSLTLWASALMDTWT